MQFVTFHRCDWLFIHKCAYVTGAFTRLLTLGVTRTNKSRFLLFLGWRVRVTFVFWKKKFKALNLEVMFQKMVLAQPLKFLQREEQQVLKAAQKLVMCCGWKMLRFCAKKKLIKKIATRNLLQNVLKSLCIVIPCSVTALVTTCEFDFCFACKVLKIQSLA